MLIYSFRILKQKISFSAELRVADTQKKTFKILKGQKLIHSISYSRLDFYSKEQHCWTKLEFQDLRVRLADLTRRSSSTEGRIVHGIERDSLGEVDPVSFSPATGSGIAPHCVRPFSIGELFAGCMEPWTDRPFVFLHRMVSSGGSQAFPVSCLLPLF